MTTKDDWFRKPNLTDGSMMEFERRLARSRSSRYEYMRIQASALAKSSGFGQALNLLDRIILECPDYVLAAWVWEQRGDCLQKMGRSDNAIEDYLKSIAIMNEHPGVRGNAVISFAGLVYDLQRSDLYQVALGHLTDFWDPNPIFPVHEFQQFGMTALLLNALGERDNAKPPARRALAAAAKGQSNAAKHRNLGLVRDGHKKMRKELQAIVGGRPFESMKIDGRALIARLKSVLPPRA